jgi:hypothetical protein
LEEKLEYTPGPVIRKTGQLYDNPEKEVEKIKLPEREKAPVTRDLTGSQVLFFYNRS